MRIYNFFIPYILSILILFTGCADPVKFFEAVESNDIPSVRSLISRGVDVNAIDTRDREIKGTHGPNFVLPSEYQTPLIIATLKGYREIVELLLAHNAEVDIKDVHGITALMYAVMNGNQEITKLLLDKGANINEQDASGQAVIVFAFAGGKQMTRLLLDRDVNLHVRDNSGRSVLMYIVRYGMKYRDIFELILDDYFFKR